MQNNFTTFRPEIKDVKIKKVELICDTYHVYGIRADIRHNCCGRRMNIHDYRTVTVRSLSYGNRKVILHIEKQRYVCPVCNKRTTSSIDVVNRNCSISNEVKDEIRRKVQDVRIIERSNRRLYILLQQQKNKGKIKRINSYFLQKSILISKLN